MKVSVLNRRMKIYKDEEMMKKRVLWMFLASLLATALTGCEVEGLNETAQTNETETAQTMESLEETVAETVIEEETQVEEIENESGEIVDQFSYEGVIYQIDENGNIAGTIILSDVTEADFLTQEQKDVLKLAEYCGTDGDRLIFIYRDYMDGYSSKVISVDMDQKTYEEIFASDKECVSYINIYQDKIYFDTYEYDHPEIYQEYAFSYGESAYESADAPLAGLISQYTENIQLGDNYGAFAKVMGENGYLLVKKDGGYVQIDEVGNETSVEINPDCYVKAYSKKYIIYYDNSTETTQYYAYDIFTKENHQISEDFDDLFLNGEEMFLLVNESKEYGVTQMHLYSYVPGTGLDEEVYSCQDVPGLSTISGESGLCFVNGNIYYLNEENDGTKWYISKYTDAGFSPESLDVVYERSPFIDYGTVTYATHTDVCENCGYEFGKVYVESIELGLDYPGVGAINEALATYSKETYDTLLNNVYEYGMNEEQVHEEDWGAYTDDVTVSDVKMLFDKYIAIDFLGFEYSGGAHGYPHIKELIFDLETGEKLELSSLYAGSDEELRDIIAKKTVEDFKTYSEEENPYFGTTEEEVYQSAYEMSLDGSEFFMEENGIAVNYYPYNMGPYASGFITVRVNYEELGIQMN